MTDFQVGQLVILATMVFGFFATEWRAKKARKIAIEDRVAAAKAADDARVASAVEAEQSRKASTAEIIERARAEAEATRIKTAAIAENLKMEAHAIAERLRLENQLSAEKIRGEAQTFREQQSTVAQHLVAKVEEATAAAKEAYTEANHVNVKIENLNQRLVTEETTRKAAAGPALDGKAAAQIDNIEATAGRIEAKQDAVTPGKDDAA